MTPKAVFPIRTPFWSSNPKFTTAMVGLTGVNIYSIWERKPIKLSNQGRN